MSRFRAIPAADAGVVPEAFAGFEWLVVDLQMVEGAPPAPEGFAPCLIIAGCVAREPASMLASSASFVNDLVAGAVHARPPTSPLN